MKHTTSLCLTAAAALILHAPLNAQQTINNATLSGRVVDPQSRVVTNAIVTATQLSTSLSHTATTDAEGRFRFPYLSVGPYRIAISHPGFATAQREITLTVGADFQLPVALSLPTAQTSIDVSASAPILEANRSQIAETISQNEVQNLSLLGRSFLDLALLTPGVSPTNTASTQLFAETSAVAGQGYSINSQRNFSNSFVVDGLSANDDAAGLSGAFYGLDTVSELQVVTSGGQAEFGRALGGYVNIITHSGTDQFHGSLYGFLRNQRLNAANALSRSTLPLTQAQYGASAGGPVVHKRTFLFGNYVDA